MSRNQKFRVLDLIMLLVTAPVWVPVMATCALAVALVSGRPVFFRQERIGHYGLPFQVLKFRSMRVSDNPEVPSADTITRVGAILRRSSLDELPQLLNVLRGEMSLVGPRPMLPRQVGALSCGQERRHLMRPGLTGLAQVNGRNSIPWADRLALDVRWATTASAGDYFRIMAATLGVVATGNGVDGNDADDPFVRLVYANDEANCTAAEPAVPVIRLETQRSKATERIAA